MGTAGQTSGMPSNQPAKKTQTTKTNTKPAATKKVAAGKAVPAKKVAAKTPVKRTRTEPTRPSATDTRRAAVKPATSRKPAAVKPKAKTVAKDSYQALLHKALTPKESKFVDEYLVDLNATQAVIRAGYSERSARQIASENLSKPHIQTAIANARAEQQKRTLIEADKVVTEAWKIVFADPRELVELRIGCCRHCYGEGHKHQRTTGEINKDREAWIDEGQPVEEFDEQGGIGFDARKPPADGCPECAGAGYSRLVLKDTRYFSEKAAALYAGAKEGKFGIEIQMHDKATFAEKLFKHLGLYEKDNEQKVDALSSLLHRVSKEGGNGFSPIAVDPEAPPARAPMGQVQADDLDDGE